MAVRYSIRSILVVTALVAAGAGALAVVKDTIEYVERDHYHGRFMEGGVTRERARSAVGDVVDTWPSHPKELK